MWASPSFIMTPGLTKETNTLPPSGFHLFLAHLKVLPLPSRLSRNLHDSGTIAYSYICNAFPNVQTNVRSRTVCSKPKRVSADKPTPEAGAIYLNPEDIPEAKQAHPLKLFKERKYYESMASSIISNMVIVCSISNI